MFGSLTKDAKRSETAHLNGFQPVDLEPPTEWYEVALCERDEETGELVITKVKRSLEPEMTFTPDDGLVPSREYTAIYRKVKFDPKDGTLFGAWTDPIRWGKPYLGPK